jgi:hypothetical protein
MVERVELTRVRVNKKKENIAIILFENIRNEDYTHYLILLQRYLPIYLGCLDFRDFSRGTELSMGFIAEMDSTSFKISRYGFRIRLFTEMTRN